MNIGKIAYYFIMETTENLCCPDEILEQVSGKLKVCGHPLRLKLLCLIERQGACVTDLWTCLQQPQPVISQHLAILKKQGIVDSSIQGNRRIYSIVDPFVKRLVQGFEVVSS